MHSDVQQLKHLAAQPLNGLNVEGMLQDPMGFAPIRAPQLLDEPESAAPTWIWQDFLAEGSLALLAAKPKTGKTTLGYELVVKIVQGLPYLGRSTRRGAVLILALEEHRRDVKRRLRDLGADQLDDLHLQFGPLDDSADTFDALRRYIPDHGIKLVLVDTLNTFWSVEDENDATAVTQSAKPILALARESGAAVLLLHHARKSEGEFGDEIRGSGALFSLVDIALILKRHEVETQRKLTAVSRYPETPTELIIELRDHGHEALGDPATVGKAAKLEKLRLVLTDVPASATDIAKSAGVPVRASHRLLEQLMDEGKASRSGAGRRGDPFLYSRFLSVSPLRGGGLHETNLPLAGQHGFDSCTPSILRGDMKQETLTASDPANDSIPATPPSPCTNSNEAKILEFEDDHVA